MLAEPIWVPALQGGDFFAASDCELVNHRTEPLTNSIVQSASRLRRPVSIGGSGQRKTPAAGDRGFLPDAESFGGLARFAHLPAHQPGQSQKSAAQQGEAPRLRNGGSGYARRRDAEIQFCTRWIEIDVEQLDRIVAFGKDRRGAWHSGSCMDATVITGDFAIDIEKRHVVGCDRKADGFLCRRE